MRIWWFAFGYFACYVPYSALTKALTSGAIHIGDVPTGLQILPVSVFASLVCALLFVFGSGWWRLTVKETRYGQLPLPSRHALLSGLCASFIIATTTLAYTFDGIGIVFVMLLMRGGVLVLAPVVDWFTGRKVRWFSLAALVLSLLALGTTVIGETNFVLTIAVGVNILIYLASYFFRLRAMSHAAKSSDRTANRRFFVEEQLVSTPALFLLLLLAAWLGPLLSDAPMFEQLRSGVTEFWAHPAVWVVLLIGGLSQGTGLFGALVLLDPNENTYSVPVNRVSSVFAGICASFLLASFFDLSPPADNELLSAGILVVAILMLTVGPKFKIGNTQAA